jgi:hypothetical protein
MMLKGLFDEFEKRTFLRSPFDKENILLNILFNKYENNMLKGC